METAEVYIYSWKGFGWNSASQYFRAVHLKLFLKLVVLEKEHATLLIGAMGSNNATLHFDYPV